MGIVDEDKGSAEPRKDSRAIGYETMPQADGSVQYSITADRYM